jgi:hypothetical protein
MTTWPKICLYAAVEHWLASPTVGRLIEQALQNAGATPLEIQEISGDDFADCVENFQCDVYSHLNDYGGDVEFVRHPQTHGIGVIYYYPIPADKQFDPQIVVKAVDEALESSQLAALPFFTQHAKRLLAGLREAKAAKVADITETSLRLLREAVQLLLDLKADPSVRFQGPHILKISDFLAKVVKS